MTKKISFMILLTTLFASSVFAAGGTMKVSVFPAPPNLLAKVEFSEPSGNNMLDAEETGKLMVTVTNSGKGDAFDVKLELIPSKTISGLQFDWEVTVGTVSAGNTVKKEIALRAGEGLSSDQLSFDVKIKEANGFDADPVKLTFQTKAFEPPKLIVADVGINDQSGNSRVEPMENVEVTARIQNIGRGDARSVVAEVVPGENVYLGGDAKTRFELGGLPAGKFKDIQFMFYTNRKIGDGQKIPIEIRLREARPQFALSKSLDLVMNAVQKSAQEVTVQGIEAPKGEIEIAGGLSIDVDMNIPAGQKAGKFDVAVIIGNRNYTAQGVPAVEFADRDARIMKEYLTRTFGFSPENVIYEENASLSKFNEIFGAKGSPQGRLNDYVKKGVSNVFIYYSGHGAPDVKSQEAYLMPADSNPQYIAASGYSLQTFYENLSKIPAKKITVMLDACFSGNTGDGKFLFKDISPAMVKVKKHYGGSANTSVITSADIDQVSSWYREKKHSLFTYYFMKGLQGEADTNKDSKITMGEMKNYLSEHIPYMAQRLNSVKQYPVFNADDKEIIVSLKK